jgi:Tfp pilus assembly protein PilO
LGENTVNLWTGKKRTLLQIDIAAVLICVAVSLVAYFTELKPLFERRFFLVSQRLNLAAQREESSRLGVSMRTLDNQLTVVREKLAQDEIKLESSERINQRIAELTALFNDSALEVDDIQTGRISIGSKCDLVPISISGRGGYKQYAAFLDKLHRTFADISVARFELQGNPEKPESAGGGGMFGIQLFWHTAHKS